MRTLIILRHAKAAAKDAAPDFDRVLSADGRAQMAWAAETLPRPDLALVSPAARTRETWDLAGQAGVEARFDRRIYEASPETLLAVVREAPDTAGTVALVGHNPGLEGLAAGLLGEGDSEIDGLPTASIASIAFDEAESWRDVGWRSGRLGFFAMPPR